MSMSASLDRRMVYRRFVVPVRLHYLELLWQLGQPRFILSAAYYHFET